MIFHSEWRVLRWDCAKVVASNGLTRTVGMIPLVGYLILFNDEIASFASFDTIAGVEDISNSPFFLEGIIKLRLAFFGSLFLLVSYLLFRIFGPEVLEGARGDLDFSSQVWESYSVYELSEMEEQVFSDKWRPRTQAFWVVLGGVRPRKRVLSGYRPDVRSSMFAKHGDYIRFLAREWWVGMVHTNWGARLATLIFGTSGYVLLALPSLDIAQAVLRDTFGGL